jgi:glutamate racemase
MDNRPIGIFDSGVGGLTVVKEIIAQLSGEDIVYLGDTARVPYGTKAASTITRFCIENTEFLLRFDVKLVIVACITASSVSLPYLRKKFNLPFAGVIQPGAKEAVRITKNYSIGVIATPATIDSGAYQRQIREINSEISVYARSCPLFVPLAEEGWVSNEITSLIAKRYLQDLKQRQVDTLILGCTHYPLLSKIIAEVMGKGVNIVNSGFEVAKEVKKTLGEKDLLSNKNNAKIRFFVTDNVKRFKEIGERFLGRKLGRVEEIKDV